MSRIKHALVLAAAAAALTGCSSAIQYPADNSDSEESYLDVETLEAGFQMEYQERLDAGGLGTVSEVTCIETSSARQFLCHATFTDGDENTTTVNVSADGQTFITH